MNKEAYEITNMDCYFICTNRPVTNPDRRHSQSIVWPARPANVPGIPFHEYERDRDAVFQAADRANANARARIESETRQGRLI